jgi:ABC-2 type transport system permease protein
MKIKDIKKSLTETLNISKYSILMYFREKTAIFFSLFIPVLLMAIFGLLNLGGGIKYNVVIVDQANNQFSQQVVGAVKKVDAFTVTTSSDLNRAKDNVKNSKQAFALVLEKDFGSSVAASQVGARTPGFNPATIKPEQINIYYDQSQNAANIQVGFTVFEKIFDGLTHQIAKVPNYFQINQISEGGNKLQYIDFLVPGLVAMSVMQFSIFAVTSVIVSWKERGILKRLLATPIHPSVIVFSQMVSRVLITVMQAGLLILMGYLLFNLHVVGNIGLAILLIVLGGLIFLALGFALSGIAKTQNTVAAVAQLFIFPQMFLSGIFFPREAFPAWLQTVSNFFPLTYFSEALRNVMVKGYDIVQIAPQLGGMAVWAVIMFGLAVWLFRWE